MNRSQNQQLRKMVLCLAAAVLSTPAFSATYEMRVFSKGLVSPLTNPVIGAVAPWSVEFGTPAFRIPTPQSNSTGAFSYTSTAPGVISLNGDEVSVVGVGSAAITATQAADPSHLPGSVQFSLQVVAATPSLGAFSNLARTFGSGSFTLVPPSSVSPGSFSYTSSNPAVAQISGAATVNLIGAGTSTITATQSATQNFTAATTTATLTVAPAAPRVVTLTETFEGARVFPLTGNASVSAGKLGGAGNFNYYLAITVPAQATNITLQAVVAVVYPGNGPSLEKNIGGTWVLQTPYYFGAPVSLTPGEYRLWGNNSGCPYAWCQNSATTIDNIVLTYSL